MLVGVDIGGTFTDICASMDGQLQVHKLLSTPHNPAQAMLAGLRAFTARLGASDADTSVAHGSTVATNAILERKGARTALLTTQGFRDILIIGRQHRPELYALQPQLPPPLIPRRWCYEVLERLDHTGAVLTPLDLEAIDVVLDDLVAQEIESLAVCFLYSYVNPAHERAVRERALARELLRAEQIVLSCEVLPEFREVERASTTAPEAYVRPVMGRYLHHLEQGLGAAAGIGARTLRLVQSRTPASVSSRDGLSRDLSLRPRDSSTPGQRTAPPLGMTGSTDDTTPMARALRIMKSDGGVMSTRRARQQAIHTALSGPAAGAIGAFHLAQLAGYDHAITIDMGGTSTDVALCPGKLVRRAESEIDGLPLRTRLLDIETIGAGGGSIARLDAGGGLHVGPESAGADPGPIVYGQGGTQVTVTDANTLLGRLDAGHFLGGAMALYPQSAQEAMAQLAGQMGLSVEQAALGIVRLTNTNCDRALRQVSVARGHDPRDFTLVAFGGAGPLHACEIAAGLDMPRVLVPRYPGVLCALGLLMADVAIESSRAVLALVSPEMMASLHRALVEMEARARADLAQEGIAEQDMLLTPLVDARYQGQSYELTIPFGQAVSEGFHAAHARAYGHAMPDRAVEIVNLRLQAVGKIAKPRIEREAEEPGDARSAHLGQKPVLCDGQTRQADLYDRAKLRPGARFSGPALVFQMDSTTYLPPNWHARVDGYHNLILERE